MQKLKLALVSCLIAPLLSGCFRSGDELTPVSSDLVACFAYIVPKPQMVTMTEADIIRLVGDLKKSERSKSMCGKKLIAWYEQQRTEKGLSN